MLAHLTMQLNCASEHRRGRPKGTVGAQLARPSSQASKYLYTRRSGSDKHRARSATEPYVTRKLHLRLFQARTCCICLLERTGRRPGRLVMTTPLGLWAGGLPALPAYAHRVCVSGIEDDPVSGRERLLALVLDHAYPDVLLRLASRSSHFLPQSYWATRIKLACHLGATDRSAENTLAPTDARRSRLSCIRLHADNSPNS